MAVQFLTESVNKLTEICDLQQEEIEVIVAKVAQHEARLSDVAPNRSHCPRCGRANSPRNLDCTVCGAAMRPPNN